MAPNLAAAWIGMLAGCMAGALPGLFFDREAWLGGYGSWRRRMIRLAHIAFFGIGLINLGFALTVRAQALSGTPVTVASWLIVTAAIAMPLVCYLSAVRRVFRHLFFIPALSLMSGIALLTWRLLAGS